MTNNPVNWFEIYVKDTARAKAFYQAVFKTTLERLDAPGPGVTEMWMFPSQEKASGAAGALVRWKADRPAATASLSIFPATTARWKPSAFPRPAAAS